MKYTIRTYSSFEMSMKKMPKYNMYAYGHGTIVDKNAKDKNRRSKRSQKIRNELRRYADY